MSELSITLKMAINCSELHKKIFMRQALILKRFPRIPEYSNDTFPFNKMKEVSKQYRKRIK